MSKMIITNPNNKVKCIIRSNIAVYKVPGSNSVATVDTVSIEIADCPNDLGTRIIEMIKDYQDNG